MMCIVEIISVPMLKLLDDAFYMCISSAEAMHGQEIVTLKCCHLINLQIFTFRAWTQETVK